MWKTINYKAVENEEMLKLTTTLFRIVWILYIVFLVVGIGVLCIPPLTPIQLILPSIVFTLGSSKAFVTIIMNIPDVIKYRKALKRLDGISVTPLQKNVIKHEMKNNPKDTLIKYMLNESFKRVIVNTNSCNVDIYFIGVNGSNTYSIDFSDINNIFYEYYAPETDVDISSLGDLIMAETPEQLTDAQSTAVQVFNMAPHPDKIIAFENGVYLIILEIVNGFLCVVLFELSSRKPIKYYVGDSWIPDRAKVELVKMFTRIHMNIK